MMNTATSTTIAPITPPTTDAKAPFVFSGSENNNLSMIKASNILIHSK